MTPKERAAAVAAFKRRRQKSLTLYLTVIFALAAFVFLH